MKSGKILGKDTLSSKRVDELKKITSKIWHDTTEKLELESRSVLDSAYREGIRKLPTAVLEDILAAHEEEFTLRTPQTVFSIKDELANRAILGPTKDE